MLRFLLHPIFCLLISIALGNSFLYASEPELSADEPITYDANDKSLVAKGNALFRHSEVIIEASEIRYDQAAERISATGNVRVTRLGLRLIAHSVTYDLTTKVFQSGPFRAGSPPLFVQGEHFSGTLEEIDLEHAEIFYGEPQKGEPSIALESAKIRPNEKITGQGVGLNLPFLGQIPLPNFDRSLDLPDLRARGRFGFRNRHGAYIQSAILFPAASDWQYGFNLDLYSKRGVLLGPILEYETEDEQSSYRNLTFSSGWISDQGDLGLDRLGDPIEQNRYFGNLSLRIEEGNTEIAAHSVYLSDSEFLRDFRPADYQSNQAPNSYIESTLYWNNIYLTAFVRASTNEFYGLVERLPEIRLEQLLTPIAQTPVLHRWDMTFSNLRITQVTGIPGTEYPQPTPAFLSALQENINFPITGPSAFTESESTRRADFNYHLEVPLNLGSWGSFKPIASGRYTRWVEELANNTNHNTERLAGELGADLVFHAFANWTIQRSNSLYSELRHILNPVVYYRWQPTQMDSALVHPFDVSLYQSLAPTLDLASRRDADSIGDRHLIRTGIENQLLGRKKVDGSTREILSVNLYYDHLYDLAPNNEEANSSYLELRASPASWLTLSLDQKFHGDTFALEATRLRTTLRSAEKWTASFALDYLDHYYHQYRTDFVYAINSKYSFLASAAYDADLGSFVYQQYGIRQKFARFWAIEYAIVFRRGDQRNDPVSFHLGINLLDF